MEPLQRAQNVAASLVLNLRLHDHVTPALSNSSGCQLQAESNSACGYFWPDPRWSSTAVLDRLGTASNH